MPDFDRQREHALLDARRGRCGTARASVFARPPFSNGGAWPALSCTAITCTGCRDDVVVLEDVDPRREVAVREEVEVLAVGVERRVQAVVEPVGDREALVLLEAVEEHLVVAVELDERVGDPLAVGRPGVVADLPEELVVLHLVGRGELRQLLRRDVQVEQREVLVAEQDLRAVRRPLEVVGVAIERRRERLPRLVAGRRPSRRSGSRRVLSE